MSTQKIKVAYDMLFDMGVLLEMHPTLSGSWVKDKKAFKVLHKLNQESIIETHEDYENHKCPYGEED